MSATLTTSILIATTLVAVFKLAVTTSEQPISLQNLYSGLHAQEKILKSGSYMEKAVLPKDDCTNCQAFYQLMHSMTEIHDEYQKLSALRAQDTENEELNALSIILDRLRQNACDLLTSTLGESVMCTYPELMKIKAKLELLFATKNAINILVAREALLSDHSETWLRGLACNVSDEALTVIQTVVTGASCQQA